MQSADDVVRLVFGDPWMMAVLRTARELALPDWWIGAGFVRAKVWDALHGRVKPTALDDVDLIYFDAECSDAARDAALEADLRRRRPDVPWSVKNQARMHQRNGDRPYRDCEEAMRHWLETATCVGVRLDADDALRVLAPFGLDDLFALKLRPTAAGRRRLGAYRHRLDAKGWQDRWPRLTVDRG